MKALFEKEIESAHSKITLFFRSLLHFLLMLHTHHSFEASLKLSRILRALIRGERLLKTHWLGKFDYINPLKIKNMRIKELVTSHSTKEEYNYNPSVKKSDDIFEVYWRISNYAIPLQSTSSLGESNQKYDSEENFEKIAYGTFRFEKDTSKIKILNQKTLEIRNVYKFSSLTRRKEKLKGNFYFTDPRLHSIKSKVLTCVVHYKKNSSDYDGLYIGMAIVNRIKNSAVLINHIDNSSIQKNWVVAEEQNDNLIMLKSTHPLVLEHIEIDSGQCKRNETIPNSQNIAFNLNGGSPFVLVDDFYMRVARLKFSIRDIGRARLNVLVKHDLNFREISRSRAFVFRETSIECCHGLDYDGDNFYFSWGENDRKMYFGSCTKKDLIDWFESNLWK